MLSKPQVFEQSLFLFKINLRESKILFPLSLVVPGAGGRGPPPEPLGGASRAGHREDGKDGVQGRSGEKFN